ncbi:hypothetical protein L226DRAFT_480270 [Lentinus tigrinus ALCF2SS1-7]|uniref:WDR59/RTC1-like RING zinc finger domain-containing protein n=1 Tax=Lentinus tigrinus ALCF2SS1-6 TaxID=1328759 RepID=A0A5C2SNG4_9APHY|nr:hypothetical protein L227DRAFT_518068 [Lentinus tigrinus ALCF2SS1-6]RPD79412.1 hypothetical protein L226DRAFT_480270 [Lentinus tigrinus ALCF2SS1-7]
MEERGRYNMRSGSFLGMPASDATIRPDVAGPPSPEDGGSFKWDAEIDMRNFMGDAVGNMSISPDNESLVLAARQGLFIMGLDDPFRQPRFIPQGGTWDVADVQWNPHLSHSEYIVSTSSEKLLIWNLLLGGRTAIEHVLRSHYRAITDINWHTIEPDIVISTGIDSWQWAWDLRTVQKPIMGLCAFGPSGTQVKWNRVDGNILASSHSNEVLIWDRRKGSLPIQRIRAHGAKIYGIDWAHDRRNELVTCSLDKTIKVWDIQATTPTTVINTTYPVWRARDLPFGQGVLSLPQRGETALEMYAYEDPTSPIEKFVGHDDVVKEFVWRRGGEANNEYQLITWSKDKTVRFWPVDTDVIEKAGVTPTRTVTMVPRRRDAKSYRNGSEGHDRPPTLSAPINNRSILAGVRAPPNKRPLRFTPRESAGPKKAAQNLGGDDHGIPRSKPIPAPALASSVMSRGPFAGGRSAAPMSPYQWISNVKMGGRREGSAETGSGGDSGNASRIRSQSRPASSLDPFTSQTYSRTRDRSLSLDRAEDDLIPTLQEEITNVVKVLNSPKLKLEKADFGGKKRTCTFGLQGPWGESTSVFLRITFAFPREYPEAPPPLGTPTVDLERSPLISMKQRAFILRRIRDIREKERPCLEKCLRFLLYGDQQEDNGRRAALDSESSSEDEAPARRDPASSVLRGDKNLAEPRTSQGVFSTNGQLVCFFRAPPRIVRNPLREISMSPSIASRGPDASAPRLFQSPGLLSDAVKRLSSAAQDQQPQSVERKRGDDTSNGNNVLRIMDNLFTFSQPAHSQPSKPRRVSDNSGQVGDAYALLSSRRSSVYIKSTEGILGIPCTEAAVRYVLQGRDFADVCKTNASVARLLGRSDHERVFRMLNVLSSKRYDQNVLLVHGGVDPLLAALATRLYEELLGEKDIQMLIFLSVLLLKTFPRAENDPSRGHRDLSSASPSPGLVASRKISIEYFDPRRPRNRQSSPFSPPMSTPPTPSHTPGGHAGAMNSPSSKGSWSSLLNTNMRQLVSGVRTSTEGAKQASSAGSRRAIIHRDPARQSSNSPLAKASWEANETLDGTVPPLSSKRRPTFSHVVSGKSALSEKRQIMFHRSADPRNMPPFLSPQMRAQLMCHILAYAEMLLAWHLPEKRGELLKMVEDDIQSLDPEPTIENETLYAAQIGVLQPCGYCNHPGDPSISRCEECHNRRPVRCAVCRLTIKGLYHVCSKCLHVSHLKCWREREDPSCACGCGCACALPVHDPLANGMVMVSPIIPASR